MVLKDKTINLIFYERQKFVIGDLIMYINTTLNKLPFAWWIELCVFYWKHCDTDIFDNLPSCSFK